MKHFVTVDHFYIARQSFGVGKKPRRPKKRLKRARKVRLTAYELSKPDSVLIDACAVFTYKCQAWPHVKGNCSPSENTYFLFSFKSDFGLN